MSRGSIAFATSAVLLACASSFALAQDAPADLLPPGFDVPAPAPTPSPTRTARPAPAPTATSVPAPTASRAAPELRAGEVVQEIPGGAARPSAPASAASAGIDLEKLPTLSELESMTTDELDEIFGLKPTVDIPPARQRSLARVGLLSPAEGGLPVNSLANQPGQLVRAAVTGIKGQLVSRWGHILLRRMLASRLAAPGDLDPAEFAAQRASLLVRLGENDVARALVQDIDTANFSPNLTNAALSAYLGSNDILGACPAVRLQRSERDDAEWRMLAAICNAHAGEPTNAYNDLRRLRNTGRADRVDALLAQRYAGAAGDGRRSVTIEWDGVEELTPWRATLARAVGAEVPAELGSAAQPWYTFSGATAPMLSPVERAAFADEAARRGVLSSQAVIDLYSLVYGEGGQGDAEETAQALRAAYVAGSGAARLEAIRAIWGDGRADPYGRYVMTAYAAARVRPTEEMAGDAAPLMASMLTAGLDRDAARWASVVEESSQAWGILAVANIGDRTA
ncbi:hypothetical protein, partial [Qipengyuania sp.]|uniref:hypothetical protein n=1 Tax=Qipengyuania sp. TaxID=2004515 RepID=UPI0035C873E2